MAETEVTKKSTEQRPTQEMRREAMKERLLEATLQVILEEGWPQASTQKISERAGVSRGAQTHHFPTKTDLLLAAIQKNVRRYHQAIDAQAESLRGDEHALRTYLDFLWDGSQEEAFLPIWLDALVASRTDAALREQVVETDAKAIGAMRDFGKQSTSDETSSELAGDLMELTAYLLRGMVVQRGAHGDDEHMRRLFERWSHIVTYVTHLDDDERDQLR